MSRDISEGDWKVFRQLHPIARDRFCQQVLFEIGSISSAPSQSAHQRYLKVFHLLSDKDKQLAALFDDPRRSNARAHLCMIASAGLLTDEELSRFTEETRKSISVYASQRI
jgi:hypothetical protein